MVSAIKKGLRRNSPPTKHVNVVKTWSKLFDISHCAALPKVYTHFSKHIPFFNEAIVTRFHGKVNTNSTLIMLLTDTDSVYSKSYHFVCGALLYSQQSWQIDKKCQQQPTSNYWAFRKIQNKWCCTKCRPIKKAWNRKRLTLALKIEVLEVHGVSVDCNTLLSKDPVTDWIVAKLRAWTEKKATELSVKIRGRARPKPASEE